VVVVATSVNIMLVVVVLAAEVAADVPLVVSLGQVQQVLAEAGVVQVIILLVVKVALGFLLLLIRTQFSAVQAAL
jgi:hypothetical protein